MTVSPASRRTRHFFAVEACLMVLAGLAVFYTMYFARALLLPITLAVLLSLVLQPITCRLYRLGVPRMVSALLVFSAMIGLGIGSATLLWNPASELVQRAPSSLKEVGKQLQSLAKPLGKLQEAKKSVDTITKLPGEQEAVPVRIEQPRLTNQMVNNTGGFVTGGTITFVLLFFLLAAGDRFLEKSMEMASTWRGKRDVIMLYREVQEKMAAYLAAVTVINIGLGVVIGFGLWMIGMPNPVMCGIVAALLNYIPFAGLAAGAILVFFVAASEFSTLGHALLAPAIYLAANGVEANFVTPAVLGRSISLDPVVILLSVFLGGWIWGIGGILVAVPVLLLVKIACDNFESLHPVGVFLAK